MPFLVRDVHGLSGLALAKAEPTIGHGFANVLRERNYKPRACLTSDQVHVDQVGFDVSRFLRLVPQALREGETQRRAGGVRTSHGLRENFVNIYARVGPVRVRIVGPRFRVRTDGWSPGVVGRVIKSHTVYRWRRGDRDTRAHNRPCSRLGSGLRRCLTSLYSALCSMVANGGSGSGVEAVAIQRNASCKTVCRVESKLDLKLGALIQSSFDLEQIKRQSLCFSV